jgi:hypothetical protein
MLVVVGCRFGLLVGGVLRVVGEFPLPHFVISQNAVTVKVWLVGVFGFGSIYFGSLPPFWRASMMT